MIVLSSIIVPTISVRINNGEDTPILRQSFTLTCDISGVENLQPNITYMWMKMNSTETPSQVGNNSNLLFFPELDTSDVGNYTCSVSISSRYLIERISNDSNPISISFQGKNFSTKKNSKFQHFNCQ